MNSEIMPGWMGYTVIRTYLSSVCLYQTLDFREVPSVYSILSVALSLSLSLSLVRSLLSIDPSMTSEERRAERGEGGKFSYFVIFGTFFLLLLDYIK